jgi:N4-acetylcytidine amidohydrolase
MSTHELPPKTCSIDRLVTKEDDLEKVMTGIKTSQRRNGRYADPGEIWEVGGRQFEVYNVFPQTLGEMTDEHARSEGMQDMESYKNYILSMHKGMPWVPSMSMWVHEFREVK